LWQGDCLPLLAAGLLPAHSVSLIVADLPYGVTQCVWDSVLPMETLWPCYTHLLKPNGAVLFTATMGFAKTLIDSNPTWFKDDLPWEKANGTNPMQAQQRTLDVHEHVLVFYARQPTFHPLMTTGHKPVRGFYDASKRMGEIYGQKTVSTHRDNPDGDRYQRSILGPYTRDLGTGHPTRKPVALLRDLLRMYSNPGDLVLDNVMGSGTTGEACVQEGRRFLGIELNPTYFATACQRIRDALAQRQKQARQGDLFATAATPTQGQLFAAD
jgi:site-specific DNA-methyltransferase (adenine-specific)